MIRPFLLASALVWGLAVPAHGASVSKTYSYFNIGGKTLVEIERELERRGPRLSSTGSRHPGATRMEFSTRIGYSERRGRCAISSVRVTVKANVILPRWHQSGAEGDVRFIWDTLAADIKRHEESHVIIAKNHARELENALRAVRAERTCEQTAARVKQVNDRILAEHDAAQEQFDRVESRNFESRILRLIEHRLQRAGATN